MSSKTSSNITTLQTFDTIWAADSVEWCPLDHFKDYFVCGTYQLLGSTSSGEDDSSQPLYNRKGRIYLAKLAVDIQQFDIIDTFETSAILDIKWLIAQRDDAVFSAASSTGNVEIFKIDADKIVKISSVSLTDSDEVLVLSLDWSDDLKMLSTDSKGNANVYNYADSQFSKEFSWHCHGFEAWTCCFDRWNRNIIYTGGDDALLNIYEIRTGLDSPQLSMKNKSHGAGVTTLLSFPDHEYKLATGSYDEIFRIFDTRQLKQSLNEINLNGGIWRIKPNRMRNDLLICANMYHNFSVLQFDETLTNLNIIGEYFEHESICYGCDWSNVGHSNKNTFYFTTCSMYDHKLNLCAIEIE